MLKGNLSSFSLGEIFQSLAINNHTGTLKITTKDGNHKCIYFSRGEISLFSSGSPETLRIGEILIRQKKLTQADLQSALEEQKTTGELLGKILLRKGMIEKDDIRVALETKIRDEVYDLFLISEAEFEFYINHLPEEMFDPLQKNTRIAINTSAVIMEGLRRVDEWRLIQRRIKTFDEIFIPIQGKGKADEEAEAEALERLDGAATVQQVFLTYPGSRFDCSKALYELIESGRVRTITVEEATAGAIAAATAGDLERALRFYRFAEQLEPARVETLISLADCLLTLKREEEAWAVRRRAAKLYFDRGMHRQAMEVAQPLFQSPAGGSKEITEIVFRAALSLRRADVARAAGNQILSRTLDEKDYPKAEGVLEELCRIDLKDLNLRIELAEVCAKGGNKTSAVAHLEAVSSELQSKKKTKELIKVLLLIFEIDPERMDVKQRIQKLLVLQERKEQRKKRQVTIMGGTVILLLLASLLPLLYELKARELYSHAQRLEEISLVSNDFSKVKAAYEEVLRSYGFSTRVSASRQALDRVRIFERMKLESLAGQRMAAEKLQQKKLQALREAFPEMLKEAKRLEDAGDVQRAFDITNKIFTELSEVPAARTVLFPMLVSSSPKGAQVDLNGVVQGATPVLLHLQKGQEVNMGLTRSGCEPDQVKVTGGQRWQSHFNLKRRPIAEFKLSGPLQQPLDAAGNRIFFPARDGYLYAVVPGKKEVAWQRRVGRYGDLVSDLGSAPEEVLLVTVSGEVSAISRENGKVRWRMRLGAAILAAPALSPDGRYVAAGSIDGEVVIVDYATGDLKGTFHAEDEVSGAAFLGEALLVGSADHRLYELAVPGAEPRSAVELAGGISTELTVHQGSVVFATADGAVHRYGPAERRVLWSRHLGSEVTAAPLLDGDRVYAGTTQGEVVALSLPSGEVAWSVKIAPAKVGRLVLGAGRLFAGAESGDFAAILPATGAREWNIKADSAILAPPLLAMGQLFVPCATGKILVLEVVE